MTLFSVVWTSYGDWCITMPFTTRVAAEKHRDTVLIPSQDRALALGDRSHYANIQIVPIEVVA